MPDRPCTAYFSTDLFIDSAAVQSKSKDKSPTPTDSPCPNSSVNDVAHNDANMASSSLSGVVDPKEIVAPNNSSGSDVVDPKEIVAPPNSNSSGVVDQKEVIAPTNSSVAVDPNVATAPTVIPNSLPPSLEADLPFSDSESPTPDANMDGSSDG